jgi:hypothetical protein
MALVGASRNVLHGAHDARAGMLRVAAILRDPGLVQPSGGIMGA